MADCSQLRSFWTNEFKLFYDPNTGLDIDGAWIDMNEPSSVCAFHLLWPNSSLKRDAYSSAITPAQTPSSKRESKTCHPQGLARPPIPVHQYLARLYSRNAPSITATTTCKTLRIQSKMMQEQVPCPTRLHL